MKLKYNKKIDYTVKSLIFLFFVVLIASLKFEHIFERDESQILLIVNYSQSFISIIKTLGYEGSTGLWHISLWCLSHVFPITPNSVSIIHFTIIVFFIAFLLFKIDVPLIYKVIFLLQSNVLWNFIYVRQYILALVFISLILDGILRKKKYLPLIWITLLMQVHVTTIPVAISFLFFIIIDNYSKLKKIDLRLLIIPLFGLIISVLQLLPPPDLAQGLRAWNFNISFYSITSHINDMISEMLIVNENLLQVICIPILAFVVLRKSYKYDRKKTIIASLSFTIAFLSFLFIRITKYICPHHTYMLFYTLLAFLAILFKGYSKNIKHSYLVLLIPILLYSTYTYKIRITDYKYAPFSYAKELAEFLDSKYPESPVLIYPETMYNSVRLYRQCETQVFSLGRNDYSNYTVWNHKSVDHASYKLIPITLEDLTNHIEIVPQEIIKQNPIIVLGSELTSIFVDDSGNEIRSDTKINDNLEIVFITSFEGKTIRFITETFVVFKLVADK